MPSLWSRASSAARRRVVPGRPDAVRSGEVLARYKYLGPVLSMPTTPFACNSAWMRDFAIGYRADTKWYKWISLAFAMEWVKMGEIGVPSMHDIKKHHNHAEILKLIADIDELKGGGRAEKKESPPS